MHVHMRSRAAGRLARSRGACSNKAVVAASLPRPSFLRAQRTAVAPLASIIPPSSSKRKSVALTAVADGPGVKRSEANGNGIPDIVRDYVPRTEPNESQLALWQRADAVCFDVDCTVTINDSLDLLAEFMGCKEEVERLTTQAMDGTMSLEVSLEKRLEIVNCTPADIRRFIKAYPPTTRLAPGIERLIKALHSRGVSVYLISGGFRELMLPVAKYLNIPPENVFANRMNWQWDDETGEPTRLVGFDMSEPTAHNQGKPQAIARIRQQNPYDSVIMIGDGITDLEAVQSTQGADLFIGYGGIIERPSVASQAEWYVYNYDTLISAMQRFKVAMVGSGSWACAAVRMLAQNTQEDDPDDEFEDEVRMWVYEEEFQGKKLSEVINETHENPKYLPGVSLGPNVKAYPKLADAVKDADCIVLCAPHQYLQGICKQMIGHVKPSAMVMSLTKGMRVGADGPQLISQMVSRYLEVDCSVLMGGNIASDIANEELSEAVIGYSNQEHAEVWSKLFARPYFRISLQPDPIGAEMCGTLKNMVALGAGIVDGLGFGPNSKAAIMRQGLFEMRKLSMALYPTVRSNTFLDACGVGDLIATCYGGRNRLVAETWTKRWKEGRPTTFEELEKELLKGQKLQGILTSNEVQAILKAKKWESSYPLFTTVNRIINGTLPPNWIFRYEEGAKDVSNLESLDIEDILPKRRAPAPKAAPAPAPAPVAAGVAQ